MTTVSNEKTIEKRQREKSFENQSKYASNLSILYLGACCAVLSRECAELKGSKEVLKQSESGALGAIVAPPSSGAIVAGGLGAGQVTQTSSNAAEQQSGQKGASAARASSGAKSTQSSSKSAAMKVYKKKGKKQGYYSAHGYGKKYGKRGGKYMTYASGHRRTYGTVKTYHHSKGFKYGHAGSYGKTGGYKKGYKAKKAHLRQASATGVEQHGRSGSNDFSAGASSRYGAAKSAGGSTGHNSGSGSQGVIAAAGKKVGVGGIAG